MDQIAGRVDSIAARAVSLGEKSQEIGRIPVDSIYSPVLKVTYKVEATRVEQRTDFDKLILDVETKNSISPRDALASAGKTLVELFGLARELNVEAEGIDMGPSPTDAALAADLALPIEDLDMFLEWEHGILHTPADRDPDRAIAGAAISRLDGEQTSTGFELEVRWQPLPNWQLQGGGAYSKARITASERNPDSINKDLINAPRKTANFWTRYNFPRGGLKGLGVGLGVVYVGEAWGGDPTSAVYFKMPAWTRVDGSMYYKWKGYDFSLNVQNLLDKRYVASAFSAQVLNIGEQRKLTFAVSTRF